MEKTTFLQEFMVFMTQYGVIGVAIGLLMATKVGEVIKSLIEDMVTPGILSPLFQKLGINKLEDLSRHGMLWGKFIARLIDFVIIAFIIFLIIKALGTNTAVPAINPATIPAA